MRPACLKSCSERSAAVEPSFSVICWAAAQVCWAPSASVPTTEHVAVTLATGAGSPYFE